MDPKEVAGREAAKLVRSGQVVGLGTGSTAKYFIQVLGERDKKEELGLTCVSTSNASEILAKSLGLKVVALTDVQKIDIAADGADKIDQKLMLVKGMGGALVREKIIDYRAEKFVVIADEGKVVKQLFGVVPVEVIPMAAKFVGKELLALGAKEATIRQEVTGPFVTDNSNWIINATFGEIKNPKKLEQEINEIAGVVDNGLFTENASIAIVGMKDGAIKRIKAK